MTETSAYGFSLFCDDVRQEMSGKHIYIGIYTGQMIFSGPPPGFANQLHIVSFFVEPKNSSEDPVKFILDATWQDESLLEIDIVPAGPRQKLPQAFPDDASENMMYSLVIPIRPLAVPKSGRLRVRYFQGPKEINGGSLAVTFADTTN